MHHALPITQIAALMGCGALAVVGLVNCHSTAGKAGHEFAFTAQAALGIAGLIGIAVLRKAGLL